MLLPVLNSSFIKEVDEVKELILSEINVKELEYITDASGLLKKKAKANFKTLGGKLGKDMKDAAAFIAELSNEQINSLEQNGSLEMSLNGTSYSLNTEDLIVSTEDLPGWKVATDEGLTVALDVTLSEALEAEGVARDLVNRIQNIRKDKNFNVTDRISVQIEQHPAVKGAVEQFGDYIKSEVLANSLSLSDSAAGDPVELNDSVTLNIQVEVS